MVEGIPYKVVWGLKFYDRMEVKDILAYLRVIHNPNDSQWIKRIINVPSRKIWQTTLQKLEDYKNNFWVSYLQIFENIEEVDDLNSWAKRAVYSFYEILLHLMEASKNMEVSELIDEIIEKIWYKEYLKDDATRDEYDARIDNINELKNVASTYNWMDPRDSLSQFLEEVMLVTDMENKNNEWSDFVTLMTIHTSKWLEYDRVFITWLEDGLFPSSRTFSEPKELEEERRLMYVAMTRAKKELYLSKASERFQYWSYINNPPSRFLKEINSEFIENYVFETNSSFFSSNYWIPNHNEPVFKIKKTIVENDVSSFNIWDKLSHPKFGFWSIISMDWDLAEIKFQTSWIKKMNIKIAPVKKI
jgi:DNA helicase-2/ATP-dependent DNA helicase PcrA